MKASEIETIYKGIKKNFFPRWDPLNEWRLVIGIHEDVKRLRVLKVDNLGYCYHEKKEIWIVPGIAPDEISQTIIHEIGHAIVGERHGQGHNPQWKAVMRGAIDTAKKLGLSAIANSVEQMIAESDRQEALAIYTFTMQVIYESRKENKTPPTYEEIVSMIGQIVGAENKQVELRYPLLKDAYERAFNDRDWAKKLKLK